MDTDKEQEISLGVKWPYQKMNSSECIVYQKLAGVNSGEKMTI